MWKFCGLIQRWRAKIIKLTSIFTEQILANIFHKISCFTVKFAYKIGSGYFAFNGI